METRSVPKQLFRFVFLFLVYVWLPLASTAQTVSIPDPNLRLAIEKALDKAPGASISVTEMESLTDLRAPNANITDLTGLEVATNLTRLELGAAYVAAEGRFINSNAISDLSPLAGLTALTRLDLEGNSITDISALNGLTNLVILGVGDNAISDISALSGLTNLFFVGLWDNLVSDISPLVANTGFGQGEEVIVSENPLSEASINVHIPALQDRGIEVHFSNLKPALVEYVLSLPKGFSLIHVPLQVTTVNGVAQTIASVGDLYDALGGASKVNYLITYNFEIQDWQGYFGDSDRDTPADQTLTDDMGIAASMIAPVSVHLSGTPLGSSGSSTLMLIPGVNLVGLPLRDERVNRVSDLFTLDGIRGNVPLITLSEGGDYKVVGRAGDPGDIPVVGGQGFIIIVQQAAKVQISGDRWGN